MTRSTLNNIFRQIVIDMAPAPGPAIDTYRASDTDPDLGHQAFGCTFQDYVDGLFWSRAFYHAGADPNAFRGSYPVLFAESRDLTQEDLNSQDMKVEYWFVLVDQIPCEDCPPYTRNAVTVSEQVLAMLRAFLAELYTYQLYEVDRAGTVTYEWMSSGRADYEIDQGSTLSREDDLISDMDPSEVTISEWRDNPNRRGWMARVVFTLCEPVTLSFDYAGPVVPGLATTECPTC